MFDNISIQINDLNSSEKYLLIENGQMDISPEQIILMKDQKKIIVQYYCMNSIQMQQDGVIIFTHGDQQVQLDQQNANLQGNYHIILKSKHYNQIHEQIQKRASSYFTNNQMLINNDSVENNYDKDNLDFEDEEWHQGKQFDQQINQNEFIFFDDQSDKILEK